MESLVYQRLNNVLISDKHIDPDNVLRVMKSDISVVIKNYLECMPETCEVALEVNDDGNYDFIFRIKAKRLKKLGILPK